MLILIVGLLLFLGIHMVRVVAPAWREARIAAMGEGRWKGTYSLVSAAGLVLIIWGYYLARADAPILYIQPDWFRGFAFLAMPIALIIFFVSDFRAGHMKRALKHPMLIGTILWSGIHLIGNGDLASVLLFGGFFVWAVVDLVSALRRPYTAPENLVLWPDFASITLGLVVTVLIVMWLHGWLFGVPLS
ncbi:MAG: NnrU family protein [Ahrensia sp.]|nr:NnrU family protein [Ahrensia sp.]